MNNPKISIITVCFNAENDIERTMLSVLDQSFKDLEYIIVDGCSTDNTLNKVRKIKQKYPFRNISLISEPDKGVYDAMNKGIRLANGEWVCLMNAGDSFAANNVLENVFAIQIPSKITFLYSDIYQAAYNGQYFIRKMNIDERKTNVIHQGVIYRKKLHEEHGYYIVTKKIIVSDYLFFLRIPVEETLKINVIIAKYEAHGISDVGFWCSQQANCADVVFRKNTFWGAVLHYVLFRLKSVFVPRTFREWFKMRLEKSHGRHIISNI